ncbi:MAG: glycosyltransferase, partial [Candidatus Electrothrix sp. AR4]|nr:glycosyltransferase [Candidatus Electrothrix sp. AR4]
DRVHDEWIITNCHIRTTQWFRENHAHYDRIMYHFGNSHFHQHMFDLLENIPGVVVLHDFYLSGVAWNMERTNCQPNFLAQMLIESHGYNALTNWFHAKDISDIVWKYPVNLSVLQNSLGVIVHSENSKRLANQWYGNNASKHMEVIPLLRVFSDMTDRKLARKKLSIPQEAFIVCSFGLLGPSKLTHRLLDAFVNSKLSENLNCYLIFVGQNHGGEYGLRLHNSIEKSSCNNRIRVTGWTDASMFKDYLISADIGVQLRTLSRGETSAAVLDCMNYGLPTIVNANGSMADLSRDAVWMLDDEFTDDELTEVLETLWMDKTKRKELGIRAKEIIQTRHDPQKCSYQYHEIIEKFYSGTKTILPNLIQSLSSLDEINNEELLLQSSSAIAANFPVHPRLKQLLIDVSAISKTDLKTGIERVVRAQIFELIKNPPKGYRVEPVFLADHNGYWEYYYARTYTCNILGLENITMIDEPIDIAKGDIFYCADFFRDGIIEASNDGLYQNWRSIGVTINFMVYDLLPILKPCFFPIGSDEGHSKWLKMILMYSENIICISKAVADELSLWIHENNIQISSKLNISYVHLGADIDSSVPVTGLPNNAERVLSAVENKLSFIMVGTIEPRKGYMQTLLAFDELWKNDIDINLVIVGKEGWKGVPDNQKRTIPAIIDKITHHAELDKHLFWLDGISDEYLKKIYAVSTCLIAASEGEGFGLPLIEAAQHNLPIIARDIPVFREVAGEHAFYFSKLEPQDLSKNIELWLKLYSENRIPESSKMPWLSWKQSVNQLTEVLNLNT